MSSRFVTCRFGRFRRFRPLRAGRRPNRQPLADEICQTLSIKIHQSQTDDLMALTICQPVASKLRRHNTPLGVATYRDSKDVPEEYKSLRPLLEGAQRLLEEEN